MAETPFLEIKNATKSYVGSKFAGINRVSLRIKPGKITAIIGESGSGKSTLLKLLFGLISPEEGAVFFEGEQVIGPEEKLLPGHDDMKMVTQQFDDLNLYARVSDNVSHLLPNTDLDAKRSKTQQRLEQLRIDHLHDHRIVDLSGGEKQRVAIARALITNPKVLLLDEPFNQVDASFREQLQHDLRKIVHETGLTVILVSHDPAEVLSLADELIVLKDGEIVESGDPKSLYQHPAQLYTARLLANSNVLTAQQSRICDIHSEADTVLIYPEWARVSKSWSNRRFVVQSVLYKGFYEELLVEREGLQLRVNSYFPGKYLPGDKVKLHIKRYIEFNN